MPRFDSDLDFHDWLNGPGPADDQRDEDDEVFARIAALERRLRDFTTQIAHLQAALRKEVA